MAEIAKPMMKSVASNVTWLYVLQGCNFIIPLFTIPYLSRTLSVGNFGNLAVATSIAWTAGIIVDWGFNLSALQEAARMRRDPAAISHLVVDVVAARMLLGVLSVCACIAVLFSVHLGRLGEAIGIATCVQCAGGVLSCGWLLQALEKMKLYVMATLFGRISGIIATFALVHKSSDLVPAAFIGGVSAIMGSVASIVIARRLIGFDLSHMSLRRAVRQMKGSFPLFVSTGAVSLYTQNNAVIVAFVAGSTQAGLFNGVDRLKRALQSLWYPVASALLPRISNEINVDRPAAIRLMTMSVCFQGAFALLVGTIAFVSAPLVVHTLLGAKFVPATITFRWMAIAVATIGLSNAFGLNVLIPLGMRKEYSTIVTAAAIVNLGLVGLLSFEYGAAGAGAAMAVTELLTTIVMAAVVRRADVRNRPAGWG